MPREMRTSVLVGMMIAVLGLVGGPGAGGQESAPGALTNSVGMKLVPVPAGSFLFAGKQLPHPFMFTQPTGFTVTIDRAYYLGACEVTQEQYAQVMGQSPAAFAGKSRPVERVSWEEAVEFCQRLSEAPAEKQAGRVYSLPSEREWQYAARAGSEYLFPYGSDDETRVAEVAVCRDGYTDAIPACTAPIAGRQPNAWGLYDVLGNVWEWCLDAQPLLGDAGQLVAANLFNTSAGNIVASAGEGRVILGGGWDNDFRACNLAARYGVYPTRKANNIGFRVKCVAQRSG